MKLKLGLEDDRDPPISGTRVSRPFITDWRLLLSIDKHWVVVGCVYSAHIHAAA